MDSRTDIYSLGAVLYELLTGCTPLDAQRLRSTGYAQMQRIIREEEPPKPSTRVSTLDGALTDVAQHRGTDMKKLGQLLRGDLDWIVMKSLDKDRGRRYETASSFAEDVERYLREEPVEASPPSAGYRLRKFVRRNKGPVAAACALTLTLVAGIAGTTTGLIRATAALEDAETERELALAAEQQAEVQRQRAMSNFRLAREVVDKLFILVSENKLLDRPDLEVVREELLETSLGYYGDFVTQARDDPELQAELAAAHLRFVQIENAMELGLRWLPHFQDAVDIVNKLVGENVTVNRFGSLRLGIYRGRGRILRPRNAEEAAAALRAFQEARDVYKKLVEEYPDEYGFQNDLAGFCNVIGVILTKVQPDAAIESLERARGIWEKLGDSQPENVDFQSDLAKTWNNIGNAQAQNGNLDAALVSFDEALRIQRKLVQKDPEDTYFQSDLGSTYLNLGKLQANAEMLTDAYRCYEQSLAIRENLVHNYPRVSQFQYLLGKAHYHLGSLHARNGQVVDADTSYERARRTFQQLMDEYPTNELYQRARNDALASSGGPQR